MTHLYTTNALTLCEPTPSLFVNQPPFVNQRFVTLCEGHAKTDGKDTPVCLTFWYTNSHLLIHKRIFYVSNSVSHLLIHKRKQKNEHVPVRLNLTSNWNHTKAAIRQPHIQNHNNCTGRLWTKTTHTVHPTTIVLGASVPNLPSCITHAAFLTL